MLNLTKDSFQIDFVPVLNVLGVLHVFPHKLHGDHPQRFNLPHAHPSDLEVSFQKNLNKKQYFCQKKNHWRNFRRYALIKAASVSISINQHQYQSASISISINQHQHQSTSICRERQREAEINVMASMLKTKKILINWHYCTKFTNVGPSVAHNQIKSS